MIDLKIHEEEDYIVIEHEHQPSASQEQILDFVSQYVDDLHDALAPINLKIHDNPELNYKEKIAHETLTKFLKTREGWKVTPSAYGIDTAFIAEYDSGRPGPVISLNAEYDALPEIGHACGHNLIAMSVLSGALAIGASMSLHNIPGKVLLFGTPAEEGGGGKIKLLEAGAYSENKVSVSLISHPGIVNDTALMRTAAYTRFQVEYFGKAAHAAAAPWEGQNALDALVNAYSALSTLRQQTMPGDIIQGHITDGGLAPNIIHAYTAGVFIVRSNTAARLKQLLEKVEACFQAGALSTGCTYKLTHDMSYKDHVPNFAMGAVYREIFNRLGGDIKVPELDYTAGQTQASTDQGDISYAMPSLNVGFAIRSPGNGPHTPGFAGAARTEESFQRALRVGKALAATGCELLMRKGLLEEVVEEWKEKMKG